jgi:DNA-binding transcriptional MerR regulator
MSRTYTVTELARLAGVSVRTLHHYDEIGLLKPAFTGTNRYRHYGETELLRLQQILIHRELDIPLNRIAAILDAQGPDRIATLKQQRDTLQTQAQRTAGMIRTIERTIARLTGEQAMTDKDLYAGMVSREKQASYEAYLVENYGPDMERHIATGKKALEAMGEVGCAQAMAEIAKIEQGLAEGLRRGLPPDAAGLAQMYEHPDFRARYEAIQPGFADYLKEAMQAWAARQA